MSEFSCSHFPTCGGCQYLTESYDLQLERKQRIVLDLFGRSKARIDPILPSPVLSGWRHKVQLPFGVRKEGRSLVPTLGCYAERTHKVVDQHECVLQHPDLSKLAWAVRDWAAREGIPVYHEKTGEGFLRHVLLRRAHASGEILLGLVCNGEKPRHFRALLRPLLERCQRMLKGGESELVGIVQDTNTRQTNVVLGGKVDSWWGRNWIRETLGPHTYRLELSTFFQVNPHQTPNLYELAASHIPDGSRILDAYCGVGTIGLWLAGKAKEVVGVESNAASIQVARATAKAAQTENAQFLQMDATAYLQSLEGRPFDVIVVDPPRKGLDLAGIEAIVQARPARLVYVSCNPSTLARDVQALGEDYDLRDVRGVDMFPHTGHVECVAHLVLKKT